VTDPWPYQDQAAQLRRPGEEPEPQPAVPQEPEFLIEPEPGPEEYPWQPVEQAEVETAAPVYEPPAVVPEEPELIEEEPASVEHAAGDFRIPDGYGVIEGSPTGTRRTVGVVVSRFNGEITNRLLETALATLTQAGVAPESIVIMPVPGAFELPLAAMALAKTRRYACIVALGCVIRGETSHYDLVAGEAASGLQLAAIETGVPISFGLLTTETREQAEERIDRAADVARTALEMADLFSRLRAVAR
jgi:6,7-dimethyl-8-ribityllumazine synthase